MNIDFYDDSREEFLRLDNSLKIIFKKRMLKLQEEFIHQRHLRHGVPYYVEDVTKQARLVYEIENETIWIIHCFATHKEYERWLSQFR